MHLDVFRKIFLQLLGKLIVFLWHFPSCLLVVGVFHHVASCRGLGGERLEGSNCHIPQKLEWRCYDGRCSVAKGRPRLHRWSKRKEAMGWGRWGKQTNHSGDRRDKNEYRVYVVCIPSRLSTTFSIASTNASKSGSTVSSPCAEAIIDCFVSCWVVAEIIRRRAFFFLKKKLSDLH
jgi:hypothetical protein